MHRVAVAVLAGIEGQISLHATTDNAASVYGALVTTTDSFLIITGSCASGNRDSSPPD
jgi:hypothetical protein